MQLFPLGLQLAAKDVTVVALLWLVTVRSWSFGK